jgi:PD-(D/E)XK nuclease superfamily
MTQQIISVDSQIINTFQACPAKCNYSFNMNLHPPEKAEALEKGDLMHKMLEIYYWFQLDTVTDNEVMKELIDNGLIRGSENVVEFCTRCGRFFSAKMNLPAEEVEETIYQFREYCLYYAHDSWHPLAVEEVGSKVLFESEDLKIIYNFKIDLVAEQGKIIAPFDHKTAKRRSEPSSLSNQFIGYCYGLGLNNIVINKIGFQKTLSPKERFNRFILTIDDARIKEWINNTVFWVMRMRESMEMNYWPMNLTSCDKYSGCIFSKLCESDPESRLYKIERDYNVEKPWDVARVLEEK